MSDYVKSTNFYIKDSLLSGNPDKIVKGSELDTEFNNIATAVASKANYASPALTGIPTAPTAPQGTNSSQIATTAFVKAGQSDVTITGGTISGVTITDLDTPLKVVDGGTGVSTILAKAVLIGNGTDPISAVAPGAAGNTLISNGTEWQSIAAHGISASEGDAPYYAARAFVTFDGTGSNGANCTLAISKNIEKVVKNADGDYTIYFDVDMPDANVAITGTALSISGQYRTITPISFSAATANIWCIENSYSPSGGYYISVKSNSSLISIIVFR